MPKKWLMIVCVLFVLGGCSTISRGGKREVGWNNKDSSRIAKKVAMDCLQGDWLEEFFASYKRAPLVTIGAIKIATNEIVKEKSLRAYLEEEFEKSKEIVLVDMYSYLIGGSQESDVFQKKNIQEKIFQSASFNSVDFILTLRITSFVDEVKDINSAEFILESELLKVKTRKSIWIGREVLETRIR